MTKTRLSFSGILFRIVLPLAAPGMVAVHALVPSAEVWRLLPELSAAGASSILVVPVERMAR